MRWIIALLLAHAVASAQPVSIAEYPLPEGNEPYQITAGPDGALWFTARLGAAGRLSTSGVLTLYYLQQGLYYCCSPVAIAAGPDSALWISEAPNVQSPTAIVQITVGGVQTRYGAMFGLVPQSIVTGPDGRLWVTENSSSSWNYIAAFTTSGTYTSYILPTIACGARTITVGPDGALWFTETLANQIGRMQTDGTLTEYAIPTPNSQPMGITSGPDGAVWFTEFTGNRIGRVTTSGSFTEYTIPTSGSAPAGITAGPDGALWFAESKANSIGRITVSGTFSRYAVPTAAASVWWIAPGPDGNLWFTEEASSKIGQVVFTSAAMRVTPSTGSFGTTLEFEGTQYAPNESVTVYANGVGSAVLAQATANGSGSFSASGSVPQVAYGPHGYLAVGQNSGKVAVAPGSITARLLVQPAKGGIDRYTSASGYGFGIQEAVNVTWDDPNVLLGTAYPGFFGSFNGSAAVEFVVPPGSATGSHVVTATGQTTGAKATAIFTVQ